jgi:Flp pilus assembly protein TadG
MKTKMIIKNQKGAAAVEFAIVLPLMVVLIFGIVEFSLMLYNKAMLTNASREGARVGIVWAYDNNNTPEILNDDTYHPTDQEIENTVINYCQNYLITFGSDTLQSTDIAITPAENVRIIAGNSGTSLSVTVTYHYDFLVIPNFITSLIGGIDLVAETVMRLE